ncbi:hypothetical protein [Hydrogenophaga sp.]|uniref:hypothetical protein n=1 Tax=Hydrogenophaga sp. TaxID=1904254 RepID=UPI003F725D82
MDIRKIASRVLEPVRHCFSQLPVVGPLVYCKWEDHKSAIKEMITILLFATAAFWLTSLILMGAESARSLGYIHVLLTTVNRGELFIFTVGFIGPILLQTSEDKPNERTFPGRHWHLLALMLLALIASAYHSQIKSAQLSGTLVQNDLDYLFQVSAGLALFVIVLRYLAMVYRKSNFSPRIEIKDKEIDFLKEYAKHRGESGVIDETKGTGE